MSRHVHAPCPLTGALASFVSSLKVEDIPEDVSRNVRSGFVDCVAVTLAGIDTTAAQVVRANLETVNATTGESVVVGGGRGSAPQAAASNATAAHALDFDDVALQGHPSAVLVPAILGEGERMGVTGGEAIAAYVVGYEVWRELSQRIASPLHEVGWHPSGVYGTVAAAAAVAWLHGLGYEQTVNALSISASFASGLVANFGASVKPFQVGRAAENGVRAVRLAKSGLTGSHVVLEHPQGFLRAIAGGSEMDLERRASVGAEHGFLRYGLNIKPYPVCYCMQRAVEAALELRRENDDVTPTSIERVTVTLSPTEALILKNHEPSTAAEAAFSVEFGTAAALVRGRVGLPELTDDAVNEPEIRRLMHAVEIEYLREPHPDIPGYALYSQIRVDTSDGGFHPSPRVFDAIGSQRRPFTRDQLHAKFAACAADTYAGATLDAAYAMFDSLDEVSDVSAVTSLFAQKPR